MDKVEEAERRGMERAAKIAESHMAQCLDDKDVQKRWPEIKAQNEVYAALIRAALEARGLKIVENK